jgi:4-hydroxybenzoate polyprenyltransferase
MAKQSAKMNKPAYSVLVVDLDETLVATDTLLESVLLFLKLHPLSFFLLFVWLLKGKSYFKDQLAQRVCPDPATLPYRQKVLEYIGKAKASGTPVILATASHRRIAAGVAEHLGLFSDVLASDAQTNLSGQRKLKAILAQTGQKPFAYIGDSAVDIPLWEAADTAVIVDPSTKLMKRLKAHPKVSLLLSEHRNRKLRTWIEAIRMHQWAKNLLLFVSPIIAQRIVEPGFFLLLILNDLFYLGDDPLHRKKKKRPLASGRVSIKQAFFLMSALLITSYLIAFLFLPLQFLLFLCIYLILTFLYSFVLKQKILVDTVVLAGLYTFRVIIGAVAVQMLVSSWLLAFSMFFFLSLALMKRYSELLKTPESVLKIPGRGYQRGDNETVMVSGIASGQISLLVFSLYMDSDRMREFYGTPHVFWLILPVLFYWLTRMWLLAHRGEMSEDPILFTIKDSISYVSLLIIALLFIISTLKVTSLYPFQFLIP